MKPAEWGLIGRSDELARIVPLLGTDERRPVIISGPAGVGKSRLMAAACDAVRDHCTVEWCAATASSTSIPFGPVTRLLAPGTGRGRLVDAFRRSIDAIAARPEPTLVAVDDAHLLDDASAVLVHHLAIERVGGVVLTVRSGEPRPDPVTALWKDGDAEYVQLEALTRDELHDFVTTVLDGPVDEETVDRLWAVTRGNLLFLREVLGAATDARLLVHVRGVWRLQGEIGAPRRVADLVHARLDVLDAADRAALSLVAFAEPIPFAILARVVDAPVLTRLGQRGLVVPEGRDPASPVRLAHPLYGEVLRAELSPLEEVDACRRLAEAALAAGVAGGSHLRWVSAWALEAGVELPLDLVGDAARAALDAADPQRAEQLAGAALARRRTFDMARTLGEALFALQRYEDADAALLEAIELAESPRQQASAAMGRAQALQVGLGEFDAAERVLADVAARVGDDSWRDVLAAQHSRMLGFEGLFEEAGDLAVPMLDADDERVRLRAVTPAATRLTLLGQFDRVLQVTEALFEPARRLRDELPHAPMWVASARAPALMFAGELAGTKALLDALNRQRDVAHPEDRGYIVIGYGRLALYEGRVATAVRHLREGISALDETNRQGRQGWGLGLLAEALAVTGDADGASAAAAEVGPGTRLTNRIYQGDTERARAWALVGAGRISAAVAALLEVADRNRDRAPVSELYALHDVVRLGDAAGVADRLGAVAAGVDGRAARAFGGARAGGPGSGCRRARCRVGGVRGLRRAVAGGRGGV